ncbi:hypothetical protein LshimejAT787_0601300 [Lyophyllum shimeji]|uniref:Uncharacterized protein n=1 Tax=Lyophyllum shimeji TaxID=47721 RepID=A0A9P3PN69_LYOSH|nr:hypothetical protein LshimejAT787_0601300 [Lyophyllum shimeji]
MQAGIMLANITAGGWPRTELYLCNERTLLSYAGGSGLEAAQIASSQCIRVSSRFNKFSSWRTIYENELEEARAVQIQDESEQPSLRLSDLSHATVIRSL